MFKFEELSYHKCYKVKNFVGIRLKADKEFFGRAIYKNGSIKEGHFKVMKNDCPADIWFENENELVEPLNLNLHGLGVKYLDDGSCQMGRFEDDQLKESFDINRE